MTGKRFDPVFDVVTSLIHQMPRMTRKICKVATTEARPGKRLHWGFSAPEVKMAFDRVGLDFGGYVKTEEGVEALRPDQLVPVLWKAVQELAAKVAALEAR